MSQVESSKTARRLKEFYPLQITKATQKWTLRELMKINDIPFSVQFGTKKKNE